MNLNFIRSFIAIYEEGNLTKASERLNITQPSLSAHLKSLREAYQDLLFVRKQYKLQPTSIAIDIYPILKESLNNIEKTLPANDIFDPKTCDYTFRIAAMDMAVHFLLPSIIDKIQLTAPHCILEIQDIDKDIEMAIREKKIDLVIDIENKHKQLERKLIWQNSLKIVCRANHPRIKNSISTQEYLQEKHLLLSHKTYGKQYLDSTVSDVMPERIIGRKISTTSEFPKHILSTDLIATLPESLVFPMFENEDYQILEVPFNYTKPSLCLYWHSSRNRDEIQQWLRGFFT